MPEPDLERPDWEPWQRLGTEAYRRRYELAVLAAPVFARFGYRGATIRALAHACHLSPAGLYHWFGSKAELATYLLHAPRMRWDTVHVDRDTSPLAQLAALVDMAIRNVPLYLVAMRMEEEIHGALDADLRRDAFREGEAVLGRLIAEAAPTLDRPAAVTLARDVIATLVGSAVAGLDAEPGQAARSRTMEVLRARLVPDHLDGTDFDRAMREGPTANRMDRVPRSVEPAVG